MTEEGKRTCPYADRPILEALRLPSSVTAPHDLLFVIGLVLSQNAAIQIVFCSGAAPPSPRGKAFASSNVLCTAKRFHITINLFARGRFPHKKRHPCTPTFPHCPCEWYHFCAAKASQKQNDAVRGAFLLTIAKKKTKIITNIVCIER